MPRSVSDVSLSNPLVGSLLFHFHIYFLFPGSCHFMIMPLPPAGTNHVTLTRTACGNHVILSDLIVTLCPVIVTQDPPTHHVAQNGAPLGLAHA